MTGWSIAATRDLVTKVRGDTHRSRIDSSLYAMAQRQFYARFHYQEVTRLLADFQDMHLKDEILLSIIHGQDNETEAALEEFMLKAGAHALACVLSIHSIADVTAFAVYWALDLQGIPRLKRERDASAATIQPILASLPQYKAVADALATLASSPHFKHVAALSNHSKHRGLLKPLLNEDWTGKREKSYEFRFAAFNYDDVPYPEEDIASVLGPAYEIASATVVKVGNEINALLSTPAA